MSKLYPACLLISCTMWTAKTIWKQNAWARICFGKGERNNRFQTERNMRGRGSSLYHVLGWLELFDIFSRYNVARAVCTWLQIDYWIITSWREWLRQVSVANRKFIRPKRRRIIILLLVYKCCLKLAVIALNCFAIPGKKIKVVKGKRYQLEEKMTSKRFKI